MLSVLFAVMLSQAPGQCYTTHKVLTYCEITGPVMNATLDAINTIPSEKWPEAKAYIRNAGIYFLTQPSCSNLYQFSSILANDLQNQFGVEYQKPMYRCGH